MPPTLSDLGLSLPPPEGRGFRHTRLGDLLLVGPAKAEKMAAADWEPEERWFRSMVVRAGTHEVLSVGFPKFFNWGEHAADTAHASERIAVGSVDVVATEKLDGSLIVRSVIDGEVHLRTRGSLEENEHVALAREVAANSIPALLDPGVGAGTSVLLELTSPSLPVVIRYPEDALTLVGVVLHGSGSLLLAGWSETRLASETLEVPLAPSIEVGAEADLIDRVRAFEGREGAVLRVESPGGEPVLLKLKGDEYLRRHRLRFALTARAVREVCAERAVESMGDFEAYLAEQGGDWELVQDARPFVEAYLAARRTAAARLIALSSEVDEAMRRHPERRDFAVEYASRLEGVEPGVAFALLDGKSEQAWARLLEAHLDRAFESLAS